MNKVIIGLVIIFIAIVVFIIFGIINRAMHKKTVNQAYELLDIISAKVKSACTQPSLEFIMGINIHDFINENNDQSKTYNDISNTISDYIFNKCSEKSRELLEGYKDKKQIYDILNNLIDKDVLDNIVIEIKDDSRYNEMLTDIYNRCFTDIIDEIESEDTILEKEFAEYENEEIKDETQEQHNQSIEEYAKAHLNEKIDELNKVYDDIEAENHINVVPVRDLRALAPLIDDEEIIPPVDDEPDVLVDDGTYEVVEYLDNINDKSLENIEE